MKKTVLLPILCLAVLVIAGCASQPAPAFFLAASSPCPNVTTIPQPLHASSQPSPTRSASGLPPDGHWIAFSAFTTLQTNRDVYIVRDDGSRLRRLTDLPGDEEQLAWSPDGTKIVFEASHGSVDQNDWDYDLWWVDLENGDLAQLTNDAAWERSPDWSPDGKYIAFSLFEKWAEGEGDVGIIEIESGRCQLLVSDPAVNVDPSWSPDGQHIVFNSNRDGDFGIYRLDLSKEIVSLTHNGFDNHSPTWSPDGRFIAFVSDRDGNSEIYVMKPDGSEVRRLTNDPTFDWHPAWSPDGDQIVFRSERDGQVGLFIMDRSGENVRFLKSTHDALWPAWQPYAQD